MPRFRAAWLIAGLAAAIMLIFAFVNAGFSPSATQEQSASGPGSLGPYAVEIVSLFNKPAWQNYSFRGVTFEFHLWSVASPAAGVICGNATEPGGTHYPYWFQDGPPSPSPQWQTWVAPDSKEAVQYLQGGTAHLIVAD